MKFIAQRCANVNPGSSFEPQTKRQKVVAKGEHLYLDDLQDIDTGRDRLTETTKKCYQSSLKRIQILKLWKI